MRPTRYGAAFVAVRSDGAVLLRRRPDNGLLGGMVEVPGSQWSSRTRRLPGPIDAPLQADWRRLPGVVVHVFTHFRLELAVWTARFDGAAPAGYWWAAAATLHEEALPSVMKKVIEVALPGATRTKPQGKAA